MTRGSKASRGESETVVGPIDWSICCCSVAKSLTLLTHGLQHSRLPCPSPSPGVCPSSCPSNWWCHPNISSSVAPFCCLQSFPPSGSFPISQYFTSDGQSNWHFRFSISPSNEYAGLISFKIDWFDLLAVRWTLKSLLQHHSLKASIFQHSALFVIQLWHLYMSMERPVVLTLWIFISKVMSLLFNTLFGFVRDRSILLLKYIADICFPLWLSLFAWNPRGFFFNFIV